MSRTVQNHAAHPERLLFGEVNGCDEYRGAVALGCGGRLVSVYNLYGYIAVPHRYRGPHHEQVDLLLFEGTSRRALPRPLVLFSARGHFSNRVLGTGPQEAS